MSQALGELGHEVTLVARSGSDLEDSISESLYHYYGVKPVFQIRTKKPLRIFGHGFFSLGILTGLEVLKLKPDLVYGRSLFSSWLAALFGFQVVLELHSKISLDRKVFGWLVSSKRVKLIVVISEALKARVFRIVGDISVLVAPDGADIPDKSEFMDPPIDIEASDHGVKVGYIGHLYPGKGGELIAMLAREMPDQLFHLIGGNPEDILRIKNISPKNVILHGYVPPGEIPSLLCEFDILLLPAGKRVMAAGNKDDIAEVMSPLKLFEYMAAGKAILASDLPVLREILKDSKNAILVPPDKPAEWSAALKKLIKDPELRDYLGLQARRDLEENYTWLKRGEMIMEKLESSIQAYD